MAFLKIVAVALLATISTCQCHVIAPALAPLPAVRYTQVAPPSVLPFSAQVNTFTRNLNVFDAPYAAGVLPGSPALVQRAILPAPVAPLNPAHYVPSAAAYPAPAFAAPAFAAPFAAGPVVSSGPFAPAPVFPSALGAPFLNGAAPVAGYPYAAGFVAPYARSVHAVAPAIAPAPLLG